MISKSILLILASKDFNEDEYLIVKKTLEKENFKVFIASDAHTLCVGNRGIKVRADVSFFNMRESNFSAIIIIGGNGIKSYWNNLHLHNLINAFAKSNKVIAAICSAPVVLAKAGLLEGKEATCYHKDKQDLENNGAIYIDNPVVFKKNIITAQDASSAQDFAQRIAERLK
ncbi:MAG: DJ-1/PfpI family protein [Melioribacteraceae bacterium]|nr:MAG: DJ-1/PfpI family protein [Melioribacteraceae bacterium]